jgi:hypothetical protein
MEKLQASRFLATSPETLVTDNARIHGCELAISIHRRLPGEYDKAS